jgi:tetratricopeptide (TPR) repeat protein
MSLEARSRTTKTLPDPHLSLCMIVRDCAAVLEPCLASIRPWVDELVVVDTGSKDRTPEVASKHGARVSRFPWRDDFSAARNESLRLAGGKWIFWMDSDDTIDEENGRKLRALADGPHRQSVWGYVMQVHCPGPGGTEDYTAVDHVKLFRNHRDLRFEGRIHEQILPAIRRVGGEVGWTDIFVVHSGSDHSPPGRRKKHERDLRILQLDVQERPDHPFVLFNLGMTFADMGEHAQAVEWLRRSIELAQPTESHLRKAYALLAASAAESGRRGEAWHVCCEGLELFPGDPELLFRKGMLAHAAGRLHEAEAAYRQALEPAAERYFSSIDQGIAGSKARHNLACVYLDMERPELAEVQWRRICEATAPPQGVMGLLVDVLIRQAKFAAAEVELEAIQATDTCAETGLLRAQLAEARGQVDAARGELETVCQRYPQHGKALEALSRFHFVHGDPGDAAEHLEELVRRYPDDGSHWHNLGAALLRMGNHAAAVERLRESLRVRPDSAPTRELLEAAERARIESREMK